MTPQYDEPYRYMPPLAGLCSVEQASKPGLSVEECVRRLKRYHYAFKRLHEIFIGRLTSEPAYELKTGFSYHAYLCCEHATALRQRVGEMREPPLGLEVVPDPHLEVFFDEILAAPTTSELLIAIYDISLPALRAAMNDHVKDTNPLADAPSVRVCRFAVLELRDMLTFGMEAIAALAPPERTEETTQWLVLLNDCLSAAGGLAGTLQPTATDVRRIHSAKPYKYDPVPRRDARFPDPYNMGVNAEAFLYDETMPPDAKVLMLLYKRLREIDVPEMMASILHETRGKPWEYYRDSSGTRRGTP